MGRRAAVYVAVWVLFAAFLLGAVGGFSRSLGALRSAHWYWVVAGVVFAALTFCAAALVTRAAVGLPLPYRRTVVAQLASSFVNKLGPPGIGSNLTIERYLERAGAGRSAALAALGLAAAMTIVVQFVVIGIATLFLRVGAVRGTPDGAGAAGGTRATGGVGGSAGSGPAIPTWVFILAAIVAMVAVLLVVVVAWRRPERARGLATQAVDGMRRIGRDLVGFARRPRRAAGLFCAQVGVVMAYALALAASMWAVGADVSLSQVVLVHVLGGSLGAILPVPGGLGAVEAGLIGGFTVVGVDAATATAGVVLFRLLTFWLPVLPGFVALSWLERRRYL
jgi:glycosyltransferase 2 family protein